jgi:hypothetical protein
VTHAPFWDGAPATDYRTDKHSSSNPSSPPSASKNVTYGPFVDGIDPSERAKQLRALQALAAVYLGSANPLVATLRQAEHDSGALPHAAELLDRVPSLTRRRILSTFGAVTWPRRGRR